MMCCSVNTKQKNRHETLPRADPIHHCKNKLNQKITLSFHYHILTHPHVMLMLTAGANDNKSVGPFMHTNVTDKNVFFSLADLQVQ